MVINHPLIDEIIVVDDGSSDNTINEIRKYKSIKILNHKKNQGKAKSMLDGCKFAKNNLVLFLDSDLKGLTDENITQLILPNLLDLSEVTISISNYHFPLNGLINTLGHEFTSGQRLLKKIIAINVLKNINGYSAELMMNQYIIDNNIRFLFVKWPNVKAVPKREKIGIKKGINSHLIGFKEIIETISPKKIIKQMLTMSRLSRKYKKQIIEYIKKKNFKSQKIIKFSAEAKKKIVS